MLKRFSYYFCLTKEGPDSYLWLTDPDLNPALEPLNTYDLGLPDLDPDPLARGLDQDLDQDPSITKQNWILLLCDFFFTFNLWKSSTFCVVYESWSVNQSYGSAAPARKKKLWINSTTGTYPCYSIVVCRSTNTKFRKFSCKQFVIILYGRIICKKNHKTVG